MYVGHFATGIAIKALSPKTQTWPIIFGVGLMDIINGILILLNIDKSTPNLNSGPYLFFDMSFIDWDHSLLMAVVLSFFWSFLFLKNKSTAFIAGLSVFSHFILDWPMHNQDLALYPYSDIHLGYGIWGTFGNASWIFEGLFSAALLYFAWMRMKSNKYSLKWPSILLLILFIQLSPLLSPLKMIAQLPEPTAHLLLGLFTAVGFILPGILLIWLMNREEHLNNTQIKPII